MSGGTDAVPMRAIADRLWLVAALVGLVITGAACGAVLTGQPHVDFYSFWNSSRLILDGRIAEVYGLQPSTLGPLMPLAYPPAFLLLIWPVSLIPFAPSFVAWVIGTGALYVAASRAPWRVAAGNPSAMMNAMVGQNGFVTSAIMLFGLNLLARKPAAGGAILGLMIIKPQLAVLLPVAVIASRSWRAIPAAVTTVLTTCSAAYWIFGTEAYRNFWTALQQYQDLLVAGRWPWEKLASIFALAMWCGAGEAIAWSLHAGVAVAAAVLAWRAWRDDWEAKIPVIAGGSLLVSPYLFTYDAVLLVAPLAWLAEKRPAWALGIALLSALPLAQALGLHWGPNTTPLAAVLSLVLMARLGRS